MTGQKEFMASGEKKRSPKHEELKAIYILSVNIYLYKLSIRIYIFGLKILLKYFY